MLFAWSTATDKIKSDKLQYREPVHKNRPNFPSNVWKKKNLKKKHQTKIPNDSNAYFRYELILPGHFRHQKYDNIMETLAQTADLSAD